MKNDIKKIIGSFESMLTGEPWFGRSAAELLGEVNPSVAFTKPGKTNHSLADLLWHMNTWAEFTLNRIEGNKEKELAAAEQTDWRKIDPKVHTWEKGLAEFNRIHNSIIRGLEKKDDKWLEKKVDYRKYNFRFLLEGLIQHDIYHLGQVAYVHKVVTG